MMLQSGARMRDGRRDKNNCGPSMDLSDDSEPSGVRGKEMGDGDQPEKQGWYSCWRKRRSEISEDGYCK